MLSLSARRLASMTFSETPTVPHLRCPSEDSTRTRTREAVPELPERTRPF